jgi:hypothetical protein
MFYHQSFELTACSWLLLALSAVPFHSPRLPSVCLVRLAVKPVGLYLRLGSFVEAFGPSIEQENNDKV